jgi:hypothetical protein
MLALTTMMALPTLPTMKTKNKVPAADAGWGRAEVLHPPGQKLNTAGRRREALEQGTDANAGTASATPGERRLSCAFL